MSPAEAAVRSVQCANDVEPGRHTPGNDSGIPLSPIEGFFSHLARRFNGVCQGVALLRLDGCVEDKPLAASLARLQDRHPKLRSALKQGADGGWRYLVSSPGPPIPVEVRDFDSHDLPWQEEMRRMLQTRLPTKTGPLALVLLLRSRSAHRTDLILAVHHAIADGSSLVGILHELLTEYQALAVTSAAQKAASLPLVAVDRAGMPGAWLKRMRARTKVFRIWRETRQGRWTSLPEGRGVTPYSQWVHWVFSREDTVALLKRCRKEEVSLTGALSAAALCSLVDCLGVEEARLKCQIPVDLRPTFEHAAGRSLQEDLGCFSSITQEFYTVGRGASLWSLAGSVHRDLREFIKDGGPSIYFNLAARALRMGPPKVSKRTTLFVTVYGALRMRNEYGDLRPRECTLMFNHDETGPSLVMEVLTIGHQLNLGFSGFGLDPAFWEQLKAQVRHRLDVAVGAAALAE